MALAELTVLARRQAGVVNIQQLRQVKVSEQTVRTYRRRGDLQRLSRGLYLVPAAASDTFDGRRGRAAWAGLLSVDPNGISTGACALYFHGVWGLPQRLAPEVALRSGAFALGASGVRVRQFKSPFETRKMGGWRVAAPVPALVQALPEFDAATAIVVLDSALHREVITPDQLDEVRRRLQGRPGSRALQPCWPQVDGRAASPVETRVRLECVRGGVPPHQLQVELRSKDGSFVARGDLGWRRPDGSWALAEADGKEVHSAPAALFHDRARQNQILLHGRHTPLRFTAQDLGTGRIVTQVRAALQM